MFANIKKDITHIPHAAWWILASVGLYVFGVGIFDAYFSLFLHSFFDDYSRVGVFLSIFTAVSALLAVPVGYIVDRTFYRTVLVLGRLLASAGLLFYFFAGATGSIPLLFVGLILQGIAFPFIWTGTESALRFATGKKGSTLLFGLYGTLASLALFLGIVLAVSTFIGRFPLYVLFLPAAIFVLVSVTPIVRIQERIGHVSLGVALREWVYDHGLGRHFFADIKVFNSEMWMMLLIGFFDKFLQVGIISFLPLFLIDSGEASLVVVGLLAASLQVPALFSFFFAEISKRGRRLIFISAGLCISAVAAFAVSQVAMSNVPLLFAAVFCAVLGLVIAGPSVSGTITNLTPRRDFGTVTALQTLLRRAGSTVAPLTVGYSMDAFGFEATFFWIAGLMAFLALFVLAFRYVWSRENMIIHLNKPSEHTYPYYL